MIRTWVLVREESGVGVFEVDMLKGVRSENGLR